MMYDEKSGGFNSRKCNSLRRHWRTFTKRMHRLRSVFRRKSSGFVSSDNTYVSFRTTITTPVMCRSLPLLDNNRDNDLLEGSMCRSSMRLSNMLDVHTAALKGKRIREKSPHGVHIDYIREDSDGDDTINEGFQLDTDEGVVLDNNFL